MSGLTKVYVSTDDNGKILDGYSSLALVPRYTKNVFCVYVPAGWCQLLREGNSVVRLEVGEWVIKTSERDFYVRDMGGSVIKLWGSFK